MLHIEKQAREIINEELEPFMRGTKPVGVLYRATPNGQIRCTVSHGALRAVFSHNRYSNGPNVIRKIRADVRRALRDVGLLSKPLQPGEIGTLGEIMIEAERAARAVAPPVAVREPETLCPDAIAEAQHQPAEDPQTMNALPPAASITKLYTPTGRNKTGRKHISHDQLAEVMKLLGKHGDVVNGAFAYADGWSDQRIAELAKPATGVVGVTRARRKHFGSFASEIQQPRRDPDKASRLDRLEARVTALEEAFTKT